MKCTCAAYYELKKFHHPTCQCSPYYKNSDGKVPVLVITDEATARRVREIINRRSHKDEDANED